MRRILSLGTLGVMLLLARGAAAGTLVATLPSELKKASCSGDVDGDCLDDSVEGALASALRPNVFYDEDESCNYQDSSLHYSRKDFFQVRPRPQSSERIVDWQPGGAAKWVNLTYFLLMPHDCQSYVVAGGHQGDSEKVEYLLYSYDLRTWYLYNGRYWHHNSPYHDFSGTYIGNLAQALGSSYPIVASDQDGHGSWPGRAIDSQDCAGPEDSFYNDCFNGSIQTAYYYGRYQPVYAGRNIGGPSPERWNSLVVNVSGSTAYSVFDVGHGTTNREYWTSTAPYGRFCGWECSIRLSDGNCYTSSHAETGCSDGLANKVDTTFFSVSTACGEAACVPVAGARNGSHYTGLDCTGTESYYTPYDSGTTQPNPDGLRYSWDGRGVAGTIYRTVTNRSFRSTSGVCTNYWPNGNTLDYFVTIYR
jgi:hypothetical protein